MKEVLEAARITLPLSSIFTASWYGMPLEEQFRIMHNADIVVTLPGSDLMNGLFMRAGSTAVVYCRFVDFIESSNEVRIWLQAMPDYQVFEVCGEEDVVFTGQAAELNLTSVKAFLRLAVADWKLRRDA
eukprot:gene30728-40862_t